MHTATAATVFINGENCKILFANIGYLKVASQVGFTAKFAVDTFPAQIGIPGVLGDGTFVIQLLSIR